jgi:hypothetical protein
MKRFVFLLPAVLFLVSCKQSYFIAEDDVYSMPDPVAMRPRSVDVKPEASYDGFIYQQENGTGTRSGYFDPNTDANTNGETRVINNYYINNGPNMGWYGRPYRANRWHHSSFYMGHGWGPSWGYSSFGWGNPWHNPWGPAWGYNPWHNPWHNPWGPAWGHNPWHNPWGPSYGWNSWGMQPWGGHYGMWGHHGGHWGNGWGGYHNWHSAPVNNAGGFASGNNSTSGFIGPRPTHAGNQNPVNMGVGRGNASPIDAGGRPTQQAIISNGSDNRGNGGFSGTPTGREIQPVAGSGRTTTAESPVLVNGSSPWNPRVDGPSRSTTVGTNNSVRPSSSNPGAVTVDRGDSGSRGNVNSSRPNNQNSPAARPSGQNASSPNTTRPSGSVSPGSSRPTNVSPAPSRQPNTSSPAPSRQPSTSSPSPSRQPNTSSPSPSRQPSTSSPGSSRSSGGSVGTSGGGRSGGSSGGSSGGGRPR